MNRIIVLCIGTYLLLSACGNDPRDHIRKIAEGVGFTNDAEVFADAWKNEESIKISEHAHSGTHVCELDSTAEFSYSLVFEKSLGSISENEIGSVIISAWMYADSVPKSFKGLSLVASVNHDSKNIFYESRPVEDSITQSKKWFFVSREIPMKFDQEEKDVFRGYVLNSSKTKVLVDDITFRFIAK